MKGLGWTDRYAGLGLGDILYDLYARGMRGDNLCAALLGLMLDGDPVAKSLSNVVDLRISKSTAPEDIELKALIAERVSKARATIAHYKTLTAGQPVAAGPPAQAVLGST